MDLTSLMQDRAYKEEYRSASMKFFNDQVRQRPRLPEEHLAQIVRDAAASDVDVLFVTRMKDKVPVATFSHPSLESKLIEVRIEADELQRKARETEDEPAVTASHHLPSLVFKNSETGDEAMKEFARADLFPIVHGDLQRLAEMARPVPNFSRAGVNFRHVLDIAQEPGGMKLCSSLLRRQSAKNWADVDAIVSCDTGGLVHPAALASHVEIPLVSI